MRTLTISPAVSSFFETLVAIANTPPSQAGGWGGYTYSWLPISLPAVPTPDANNKEEVAFFNVVCMPLYNAVAAAAAIGTTIVNPPVQTLSDIQAAAAAGDPAAQQAMTAYYFQQASSSAP